MIDLLAPFADAHVVVAGLAYRGSMAYWLGLAQHTLGQDEAAERSLRSAVTAHIAVSSPPWIALSQAALADVLDGRPDAEAGREAAALRDQAARAAAELGMEVLLRRLTAH